MAEPRDERVTIILFGASWCAPCKAELRNLPALAKAAEPMRIEIAWIDRAPPPSARMAGPNMVVLSPMAATRKFESIADGNHGLPVMAMIDRSGRTCIVHRGPATVARIRGLGKDCAS